jgi:transcriptional regulator with XRE-family HTH domain
VHNRSVSPAQYKDILAANIRAMRARKGLGQDALAARMRSLGLGHWIRQTVAASEKGSRRVTAEEIFALALALQTSITALMGEAGDEKVIELPGGSLDAEDLRTLASGRNNGAVQWDGDRPVFSKGVNSWWGDREDDPARAWES